MKARECYMDRSVLGGVVGLMAESLARGTGRHEEKPPATGNALSAGLWQRLASWFWQQKRHGVDGDLVRSRDIFESLDRWLWKQQIRQTEAWLSQSKDVYELERRIRRLERGAVRFGSPAEAADCG